MLKFAFAIAGVFVLAASGPLEAQSALKGSPTAMKKQNRVAQKQDYTFLQTSNDVRRFVDNGYLVPVKPTGALKLEGVSFPYARPAVKTFAERLASQYSSACGSKLVVTSLTRPLSRQPRNAHELSVHPAGMAMDIRVSNKRACRTWLENTLVSLEKKGVLDATRERYPAHYHVAVFPTAYFQYLGRITGEEPSTRLAQKSSAKKDSRIAKVDQPQYASVLPLPSKASGEPTMHKVVAGESLWSIARRHNVTVNALKDANGIKGSRIKAGQVLKIPRSRSAGAD